MTARDEMVERVAQAIYDAGETHGLNDFYVSDARVLGRAALDAIQPTGVAELTADAEQFLEGLYVCTRDESAWAAGTMSLDDFHRADQDEDVVNDLASMLAEARAAALPVPRAENPVDLEDRYTVTRNDGRSVPGEKHHGCRYFVLDLTHDPKAAPLVAAYFDQPAPRTVETVKELEALPRDTPLLLADGTLSWSANILMLGRDGASRNFPATVLTPAPVVSAEQVERMVDGYRGRRSQSWIDGYHRAFRDLARGDLRAANIPTEGGES